MSTNLESMRIKRVQGQITEREYLRYLRAWTWTVPRFAGPIGRVHTLYYTTQGPRTYYERIDRMRKVLKLGALPS